MPELDTTDARILEIMFEDGRRSFRKIARLAGITTPTVQARVKRMMDAGLIRKISPILDTSKLEQGIVCLLYLSINPSEIEKTAEKLGHRPEVKGMYLTTGEDNLVLRIVVDSLNDLQRFSEMLDREFGVKHHTSQMVVRTFKDDQAVLLRPGVGVRLQCETCSGAITGKPFILKVAGRERYFCCRTCLDKFREKYEVKLKGLSITLQTPEFPP